MSTRKRTCESDDASKEAWVVDRLTLLVLRAFEDRLAVDRPKVMVRRVIGTSGRILADAQEQGWVSHNVVRDLPQKRQHRHGRERQAERRQSGKLKIGIDIPTPEEVPQLLVHVVPRWKPLIAAAVFTGSASELRGLAASGC
jgi:hypothetical protein